MIMFKSTFFYVILTRKPQNVGELKQDSAVFAVHKL